MKKFIIYLAICILLVSLVNATATFRSGQYGVTWLYRYDAGTTSFTTINNDDDFDLFTDDFEVGDAFYFQYWTDCGRGWLFNITTAILADSYKLLYQTRSGGTWVNMSYVGDDTEQFSKVGEYGIGWNFDNNCASGDDLGVPVDYRRNMRIIVAEVTNPTEGGHIGSDNNDYVWIMPSASIHITGSDSLSGIYADDLATTRYLVNSRNITDGSYHNATLQPQSPSAIDVPLTIKTENSDTTSYVNVTCEMANGVTRTFETTFSGNETQTDVIDCYKLMNFATSGVGRISISQDRFGCIGKIASTTTKGLAKDFYYSGNCQIIVGDSSTATSLSISNSALFVRDEIIPYYYANNPYDEGGVATQIIVTDGATFTSGSADGTTGMGVNGGLIIQSTGTGWGPVLQSMSGSTVNLYNHVTWGNMGGQGGLEISSGSTASVVDSFFSYGSRFNMRGAMTWLRSYIGNWRERVSVWYDGCGFVDGMRVTGTSASYFKEDASANACWENSLAYMVRALGNNHNITLIDSEVTVFDSTSNSGVVDRNTLDLTVKDYLGKLLSGVSVSLYANDGNYADANETFPMITGYGRIINEVTYRYNFNDVDTYYNNFTLTLSKDGYETETINGIPLDKKTVMTVRMRNSIFDDKGRDDIGGAYR